MSRFAIRAPFFVIVCCLIAAVLGIAAVVRMPLAIGGTAKAPQLTQSRGR